MCSVVGRYSPLNLLLAVPLSQPPSPEAPLSVAPTLPPTTSFDDVQWPLTSSHVSIELPLHPNSGDCVGRGSGGRLPRVFGSRPLLAMFTINLRMFGCSEHQHSTSATTSLLHILLPILLPLPTTLLPSPPTLLRKPLANASAAHPSPSLRGVPSFPCSWNSCFCCYHRVCSYVVHPRPIVYLYLSPLYTNTYSFDYPFTRRHRPGPPAFTLRS